MARKTMEELMLQYEQMSEYEKAAYARGITAIAGVDEVGRGPLAGPVVTAAVILDPNQPVYGVNDSKKLSEKARARLKLEIEEKALAIGIGIVDVEKFVLRVDLHIQVRKINIEIGLIEFCGHTA